MTAGPRANALTVMTLALTAGVFVLDLWAPATMAVPVLYAGVVFVSQWSPWPRYPIALAAFCTLLTGGAFFGPSPAAATVELANGALAVFLIWTIVAVGLLKRRTENTVVALWRINEKLSSSLDLDTLTDGLVRQTVFLVDAEGGCLGLRTPQGMVCRRYFRGAEVLPLEHCWAEGEGLPGWLVAHRRPYITNEAASDALVRDEPWAALAVRSLIAVPLLGSAGEVVGFLQLHNKKGRGFGPSDQQKLEAVSPPASIAVQNALAYRELQHAEAVRRHLLDRVISAQEEERRRIARELHDEIGQLLTSLLVGLRSVEEMATPEAMGARIEKLRKDTATTLTEVRRLARGLRPNLLDDLGLDAALSLYAEEFGRTNGIRTDVHVTGLSNTRLPSPVETALYRIAQEALTNAARHAGATTVSLVVRRGPSEVRLVVEDDGRGFDADTALQPTRDHLGLLGMRERATLLNGRLWLESGPGKGAAVYVALPLGGIGA
jgi:signal transduction histidine kinase